MRLCETYQMASELEGSLRSGYLIEDVIFGALLVNTKIESKFLYDYIAESRVWFLLQLEHWGV